MEALVIIPTYNEHENIDALMKNIFGLKIDLGVLVVDDNSPDGTGDRVEELMETYPQLNVLRRPSKMGLGSAYIAGFKWALDNFERRFRTSTLFWGPDICMASQ